MLNIVYMVGLFVTGFIAWPIWTPAWAALIGVGLYHFDRPQIWRHYEGLFSDKMNGGVAMLIGGLYATNLVLAIVIYGVGRVIGHFI